MKGRASDGLRDAVLVRSDRVHTWHSTRIIRENIISSYKYINPKIKVIRYGWDEEKTANTVLKDIVRRKIKKIIFVESHPNPKFFIYNILRFPNSIKEICFHIYGDFKDFIPEWVELFSVLKKKRVKIICSSQAQRNLIKTILGADSQRVEVVPFSLDYKKIKISKESRIAAKKKLGFDRNDFILTYAGRISMQKNVDLFLLFTQKFIERNPCLGKRIKVIIAGEFDDISFAPNTQYQNHWDQWYGLLSDDLKERVDFLGFLDAKALERLNLASDVFTSLSTFINEDFGMAPLEALSMGCPAILTNWGGYSDFGKNKKRVWLVPVRSNSTSLQINYDSFEKGLLFLMTRNAKEKRGRLARSFQRKYSVEAVAKKLKVVHGKTFKPLLRSLKEKPHSFLKAWIPRHRKSHPQNGSWYDTGQVMK